MHKSFEIKASWGKKQGGLIKTIKRRWFCLFEDDVKYYTDEDKKEEKGSIPFSKDSYVEVDLSYKIQPCFNVYCAENKRTYHICPETEIDRDEWIGMIGNLITLKNTMGNPKYITRMAKFYTYWITPSELIWDIKKENIETIIDMLKAAFHKNLLTHRQILRMIDHISKNRLKNLELYVQLATDYIRTQKIRDGEQNLKGSKHLLAMLIKRGVVHGSLPEEFENMTEKEILEGYPQGSILNVLLNDNLQGLQQIVDKGNFNIDAPIEGYKLVNQAARHGAVRCFKYLFKETPCYDEEMFNDACFGGSREILEMLMEQSTVPPASIDFAVMNHQIPLVTWLQKEHKKEFNWIPCLAGYNFKCFFDRVYSNPNINVTDFNGCTPMMAAAAGGFSGLLILLRECEGNIDQIGKDGYTPLCFAAMNDQIECGNYLINNHTNLEANTKDGTALVIAAKNGASKFLQLLIQGNANPNAVDKEGNSALIYAAMSNDEELVRFLLDNRATPNTLNKLRETALFYAVDNKNYNIVKLLLERKATADLHNEKNQSPILRACHHNDQNIVDQLIRNGAKVDDTDALNNTPLMIAIKDGNCDVIKVLIQRGANPNVYDKDGLTPLMFCAKNNLAGPARAIIGCGVNMEVLDYEGKTALMHACLSNNVDVMKVLIEHKCNIECIDKYGRTPVLLSIAAKNYDAAYCLAQAGCNLFCKDIAGSTILYYSAFYGDTRMAKWFIDHCPNLSDQIDIIIDEQTPLIVASAQMNAKLVDLLVASGAHTEVFNVRGMTPMCIAAANNDFETIKAFVKNRTPVDGRDAKLNTPLMHACSSNAVEIAKYLVDCGAAIEAKNAMGSTPLSFAVANDCKDIVSFLLFKKANVNNIDSMGSTPLMLAVINGSQDVVKLLLDFNADTEIKNKEGRTALDLCIVHGAGSCEKLIKERRRLH